MNLRDIKIDLKRDIKYAVNMFSARTNVPNDIEGFAYILGYVSGDQTAHIFIDRGIEFRNADALVKQYANLTGEVIRHFYADAFGAQLPQTRRGPDSLRDSFRAGFLTGVKSYLFNVRAREA